MPTEQRADRNRCWITLAACAAVFVPANLHGRATAAELLAQVAPSGPVSHRRELLSDLRPIGLDDGTKAMTALLGDSRWEPIAPVWVQSARVLGPNETPPTDAEVLESLKRDCIRFYDCSQLWFVDTTLYPEAGTDLKKVLDPVNSPSVYARETAFVGRVDQWAIYAYMPIWSWIFAQQRFKAVGGDDPFAAAVRGLQITDRGGSTANSSESILVAAGAKAVPYLRNLIARSPPAPVIWRACCALARTKTREAGEALAGYARDSSPALASSARKALVFYRLPEGRELYFGWMEQDAGKTDVRELLEACAATDKRRLGLFLPRILAQPHGPFEYRRAFDLARELSSKPIPSRLLDAEKTLRQFTPSGSPDADRQELDRLVGAIVTSPDAEAAAHLGLSLLLSAGKGAPPWGDAGRRILCGLPSDTVRRVVTPLLASCKYDWVQSDLKSILKDLR